MDASWYQEGKGALDDIVDHFNGVMRGLERYQDLLIRIKGEMEATEGVVNQAEFLAWLEGQTGRVQQAINQMDQEVWDHVTRFLDRNIRIKHWEDSEFV